MQAYSKEKAESSRHRCVCLNSLKDEKYQINYFI